VPLLEAIIAKPWGKEDELKALKSELAALDRKITAELAPKHDEKDVRKSSEIISRSKFNEWRHRHNPMAIRSRW
jgi:hypothetical protein